MHISDLEPLSVVLIKTHHCKNVKYNPTEISKYCLRGDLFFLVFAKNKTNHPMSSNSHPSVTANEVRHRLKWEEEQNQQGHHLIFTKYEALHPIAVSVLVQIGEKKEEIWLSPMTKAPTPTEMSKGQSDNTNNATKKFD